MQITQAVIENDLISRMKENHIEVLLDIRKIGPKKPGMIKGGYNENKVITR